MRIKLQIPFRKSFQGWRVWELAWFWGILASFWFAQSLYSYRIGDNTNFQTDSATEGMTIFAANHYLDHGFFENYLLPTYPPFGHDPSGKMRTEPFVYNHYLAGQDLLLAGIMKVFGRNAIWLGRIVPHTLTVFAMGFLSYQFAVFMGAAVMGCFMLSMLMIPRALTAWSISLYGHSHAMAFYLLMVGGILWLINNQNRRFIKRYAWAWGIVVGLGQMFFEFDWVALTIISSLSLMVLLPELKAAQGKRFFLGLCVGVGAAGIYQLVISSLYFGSPWWVISNISEWMAFRAGAHYVEGITEGDLRLHKVLQEYNRQAYGSTGFTAFNYMALSGAFLVMGFLGFVRDKKSVLRGLCSIVLAYLAAAIWNIVMRQHSVAHLHFIPRHYITIFINFVFIALPISYHLIMRSRAVRAAH